MSTTLTAPHAAPPAVAPHRHTLRRMVRVYRVEAWQEFLKLVRLPIFAATTVALPLMFYVIFGITFAGEQARGVGVTTYMLVTYGAFGVIGAALFGFGVSVAVERGQGWMRLKRVAPMPPLAYFVAKVAMSLAVATIIVLAMFVLAATLGGVRLDPQQWAAVGLALVAGALPFSAMGLAFGYLVGPNSAGGAEYGVAADGVRVRAVDPHLAAARGGPVGRSRAAAVPLRPARPGHSRCVGGRIPGCSRRRSAGLHRAVPGRGSLGVPA
jgi:hypothetical protein